VLFLYVNVTDLYVARCSSTTTYSSSFFTATFAERIRILSNLALSNFIIPTVISIVQLALVFRIGDANPTLLNDIAFVNAMVSVFGVVFATVWAGKEHRREAKMSPNPFPIECEQRYTHGLDRWRVSPHPPVNVANIDIEHYQGNNVSSAKDMGNQGNRLLFFRWRYLVLLFMILDDDLVEGRDIALLPQLCEPGSAIQRTVRLSGD
jgi:hypothetical protein